MLSYINLLKEAPLNRIILLADGHTTFVMYMGTILKRMGFDFFHADNGPDALCLMKVVQPDVVMVDSELPVFDGLETLPRVYDGGLSLPPVIMLATTPTAETERRRHDVGAWAVITKPVLLQDLHDAIQECLAGSGALNARRRHIRVDADVRVTVSHNGQELDLVAKTISAGGMFIGHGQALPVGGLVDISVDMGDGKRQRLAGKVIYNHMPGKGAFGICPGFAVAFHRPGLQDVAAMEGLVSRFVAEDITGSQGEEYIGREEPKPGHRHFGDAVYSDLRSYPRDKGVSAENHVETIPESEDLAP
jgi:DNA-binding response OmpR family regulator